MADTKIQLVVEGVDLDDDSTLDIIGERLAEYSWAETDGTVTVAHIGPSQDVVETASTLAQSIRNYLPSARARCYDDDLVGYSEIALRANVTTEAVRLWATGQRGPGGFPSRAAMIGVGQRRSPIWAWGGVSEWLDLHYSLGDGVRYPSDDEVALINASLVRLRDREATPEADFVVVGRNATYLYEVKSPAINVDFSWNLIRTASEHLEALQADRNESLHRMLWYFFRQSQDLDSEEDDGEVSRHSTEWVSV